jgi:hypothetical protein
MVCRCNKWNRGEERREKEREHIIWECEVAEEFVIPIFVVIPISLLPLSPFRFTNVERILKGWGERGAYQASLYTVL